MTVQTIRKERQLLKQITKRSNDNHLISFEDLGLTSSDYYIQLLKSKKFITFSNTDDWGNNPKSIKLTQEGLHYFEWKHEDTTIFVKEKLITPITVSIATTLLTLLATQLLKWLL